MTCALIAAGGERLPAHRALQLPPVDLAIAADDGLAHLTALGLHADVAVGDFDSASAELVTRAASAGTRIVRHPPDKDASDLELALREACALGARRVLVIGAGGGRLDHLLAGLLLLASAEWQQLALEAWVGTATLQVVRRRTELGAREGERVTLLAAAGRAAGVTTTGLRWALRGEDLDPGSTRGLSNVVEQSPASVSLTSGVLFAVRPDASPHPPDPHDEGVDR